MAPHAIIAIGASAGGTEALSELASRLQPDIPAAILVVVHVAPYHDTLLPSILSKAGPLPATKAVHGEPLKAGHIYVAPADRHMVVRDSRIELNREPRENHTRPAIDPLMRTVARAWRERAAGVVLSGTMSDGTVGLMAIKANGGLTIVQDPDEVVYSGMPRRALQYAIVDQVASIRDIPALLMDFAASNRAEGSSAKNPDFETRRVHSDFERQVRGDIASQLSIYSCPECGGALWQFDETGAPRFRCHVGHSYSAEMLLIDKSEALETALWSAVRTLVERATLTRQLAERLRQSGKMDEASALDQQAQLEEEHMTVIRDLIMNNTPNPGSVSDFLAEADESREPGA
jgi:two-component system chemotaxis response regulator CheB